MSRAKLELTEHAMESLYLLIPFSVAIVFFIAFVFWRSLRGGQFDDLEGPGFRVLMDDDRAQDESGKNTMRGKDDKGNRL